MKSTLIDESVGQHEPDSLSFFIKFINFRLVSLVFEGLQLVHFLWIVHLLVLLPTGFPQILGQIPQLFQRSIFDSRIDIVQFALEVLRLQSVGRRFLLFKGPGRRDLQLRKWTFPHLYKYIFILLKRESIEPLLFRSKIKSNCHQLFKLWFAILNHHLFQWLIILIKTKLSGVGEDVSVVHQSQHRSGTCVCCKWHSNMDYLNRSLKAQHFEIKKQKNKDLEAGLNTSAFHIEKNGIFMAVYQSNNR